MKPILLFPLVVLVGAGFWWFVGNQSHDDTTLVNEPASTVLLQDEPAIALKNESAESNSDVVKPTAEILATGLELQAEGNGDDIASDDEESPFALVDGEDSQQQLEQAAEEQTQVADFDNTQNQVSATTGIASDTANRQALQNIEVPSSYSVTEAEKYFVPRDERRPGNLGGPPPLNFPGGPSDPNRESADGQFQPPTAPGQ